MTAAQALADALLVLQDRGEKKGKLVNMEGLPAHTVVPLAGPDLPDGPTTGSIVVRMRRRPPHKQLDSYGPRLHEAEGHALCACRLHGLPRARRHGARPDLPAESEDGYADVGEPLILLARGVSARHPRCSTVLGGRTA